MANFDRVGDEDGVLASINIIPFVDIVLVLLVIFMLTSATIMRAGLKVELPKAASSGSTVASTLNFVLARNGTLTVNGAQLALADAGPVVLRQSRANPKTQAVISADRGVEYGRVIEVIDLVKLNGVSTFALDVERRAAATTPSGVMPPSGAP
jgi:biopolymer transport protein ExbD